jgi:hypothetical protein
MNKQIRKIFNALKERRFSTTVRVLGEEKACHASVKIVSQKGTAPAWWDATNNRITLNDAEPHQRNEKLTLIWERGKLYHELFHLIFTTDMELRQQLSLKSRDTSKFLWISNALEDGRIEWHGDRLYEGCTPYIRTVLQELADEESAMSGLLIYVRTRLWRNRKEQQFWAKYEPLINQCVEAPSSAFVWNAAFSIVEDMVQNQPKQPEPQPSTLENKDSDEQSAGDEQSDQSDQPSNEEPQDDAGQDEQGQDSGESKEEDGEDSDESDESSDESEDSDESDEFDESDENGEDDFPEPPKVEADKDSTQESEDEGKSDLESVPTSMDENVRSEIDDMVDDAMQKVEQEVKDELVELNQELADYEVPQEYASHVEESDATELGELFNSLQVESSRQRYQPCKYGGTLDPDRLIDTRTDGMFMHESVDRPAQPHIVLLIDESCSMEPSRHEVSEAARILCGAIRASGAKSVAVSFGNWSGGKQVAIHPVIPVEGLRCDGNSTPTHLGLRAAAQWLEEQQARRGMVIVVTDGSPDSPTAAGAAFEDLKANGYYVLNVVMGIHVSGEDTLRLMCHEFVRVNTARELLATLEPPLSGFMAGAF